MAQEAKKARGFSVLELVVVVSILTILASTITPHLTRLVMKSRLSRFEDELRSLKVALQDLHTDLGLYPSDATISSDPGLHQRSLVPAQYRGNWNGPYVDPWPESHPFGGTYDYDYGGEDDFNYDNVAGNEVMIVVRGNLTLEVLNMIDAHLDDGSPFTGNVRHDARPILRYYVGEGPHW